MIFVPGDTHVDGTAKDLLKAVGLEHLARGIEPKPSEGPDGLRGRLFWWSDSTVAGHFLYKPEVQTWIPSAKSGDRKSGAYWVGFFNDSPPTEEDLRKPDRRSGPFVKLGNGERWAIVFPGSLDKDALLNADGNITWVVDEAFNWLVTSVEKRTAETKATEDENGDFTMIFDDEKDWRFFCDVLAINYRVTPEVVSHLRLFSRRTVRELLAAMMGLYLKNA